MQDYNAFAMQQKCMCVRVCVCVNTLFLVISANPRLNICKQSTKQTKFDSILFKPYFIKTERDPRISHTHTHARAHARCFSRKQVLNKDWKTF